MWGIHWETSVYCTLCCSIFFFSTFAIIYGQLIVAVNQTLLIKFALRLQPLPVKHTVMLLGCGWCIASSIILALALHTLPILSMCFPSDTNNVKVHISALFIGITMTVFLGIYIIIAALNLLNLLHVKSCAEQVDIKISQIITRMALRTLFQFLSNTISLSSLSAILILPIFGVVIPTLVYKWLFVSLIPITNYTLAFTYTFTTRNFINLAKSCQSWT